MITYQIIGALSWLLQLYYYALIARILLSWFPQFQNRFVSFLYQITEPYLGIFRKVIPPLGMIDLSPIVAFLVFGYLKYFLLSGLKIVLDVILN